MEAVEFRSRIWPFNRTSYWIRAAARILISILLSGERRL
jgi:hypothetical protein